MIDYKAKDIRDIHLRFNTLLNHGNFVEVAQILQDFDIKNKASAILVTYVSAAWIAQKEYRQEYFEFFRKVESALFYRGDQKDALAGLEPLWKTDVHTRHCCVKHGCKYNDDDCTVYHGSLKQEYPCEYCGFEDEGYEDEGCYDNPDYDMEKLLRDTVKSLKHIKCSDEVRVKLEAIVDKIDSVVPPKEFDDDL
jgi:hypothetical protein